MKSTRNRSTENKPTHIEYLGGGFLDLPNVELKKLNLSDPLDPSTLRFPLACCGRGPTPTVEITPSSVAGGVLSTRERGLFGMLENGDVTSFDLRPTLPPSRSLSLSPPRDDPDSVERPRKRRRFVTADMSPAPVSVYEM